MCGVVWGLFWIYVSLYLWWIVDFIDVLKVFINCL